MLLPAIRREAETNRGRLKGFILECIEMTPDALKELRTSKSLTVVQSYVVEQLLEALTNKYLPKFLLEVGLGPLVEDGNLLTEDEKRFLAIYREKRDGLVHSKSLHSLPDPGDGSDGTGSS